MIDDIHVRRAALEDIDELAGILVEVVHHGASVGFMLPFSHEDARRFWHVALASAAAGERIVLVAEERNRGRVLGTVQLILALPKNQPHRAEVAKMQVRRNARGRGIGTLLLQAVENEARMSGRTLLVLDTATGSDAERLYSRQGWQRCGVIPGYAWWPDGKSLGATTVFYRILE